jgi:hypothetical protein
MKKVDVYNRSSYPPPLSPFVARSEGKLSDVAKKIGVAEKDLSEFLDDMNRILPSV